MTAEGSEHEGLGLRAILAALACVALTALASSCRGGRDADAQTWVEVAGRRWRVRLATNEDQWTRGLAGVERLADDEGMLFVFSRAAVRGFWMRGCLIPLDVAFIDSGGKIVRMHTMPVGAGEDLPTYSSDVPVRYALEVPAGGLEKAGVRVGEAVTFSPAILEVTKGRGVP